MPASEFVFSEEKDRLLKATRGVGFKDIIGYIEAGGLLDVIDHPEQKKYPGQKIYVVDVGGYVWLVPHRYSEGQIVLKTAFPSRKATKAYVNERKK